MRRALWPAIITSWLVHVFFGLALIRDSAATYDEPVHLASGYTDLINPGYRLNSLDHPPFAEMWAALPLLALHPAALFSNLDWQARRVYNYADAFLYRNRVGAQTLLDTARVWFLLTWSLLIGAGIFTWVWRLAGAEGVLGAALLFAFCPPLFSNEALITTDAASAAFFFLTFAILSVPRHNRKVWVAAGICLGLALAAKFNMVLLPVMAVGLTLALAQVEGGQPPWAGLALALTSAVIVVAIVYRIAWISLYWDGVVATFSRLSQGRASFLHGEHGVSGQLAYFPVALMIKTPLVLLAAAAIGKIGWLRKPFGARAWVVLPAAGYFVAALFSKTQIGYRHILPVYPFLVVLGACGLAALLRRGLWGRCAAVLLSVGLATSVARAHPHYLAYFNELSGGPAHGYEYLVDSNLDWGQGLKDLSIEVKRRGNPVIYLSYFGVADPSYYGLRYWPVGCISNVERRDGIALPTESGPILFAVSATNLQTVYYADHHVFDWLKQRRPVAVIGYSIFLYDLTDDAVARQHLIALAAIAPSAH